MDGNENRFQWDHEHVRRVRKEKERYRGDKDKENLLRMVTESAYSEETHYVLELIQNAEDEGSRTITFTIKNDSILVENDGEPFSADDVFSICSAGQSRKENKIGFFGIGFKSVFNLTKNPQVISGKYNFLISEYIYPDTTDEVPDSVEGFDQSKGAFFVLPINAKKGLNGKRFAKGLYEVNERLMLFLETLERIVFNDMTGEEGKTWEIRKEELGSDFVRIVNTGTGLTSTWRVFRKTIRVPLNKKIRVKGKEKAVRSTVVIAFPHPDENTDVKAEKVYCFLPTKTRTDLPFLIQGDFIPTLGRESIEKNEWNRWLLKKLGELAAESFLDMRGDALFSYHLYDLIPLPDEVLDEMIRITDTEPNAEAYYDEGDNTLFVLEVEDWLENCRDAISGEICKILKSTSLPLGTQIESLLSAGFDEELRERKFSSFGIPQDVLRDFIEPGEQKLREGKKRGSDLEKEVGKDKGESETDSDKQPEEKGEKDVTKKPKTSDIFTFKKEELISLGNYSGSPTMEPQLTDE